MDDMIFRILFVVLAVAFAHGAIGTLRRAPQFAQTMDRVGVPRPLAQVIVVLELLAAVGLVGGLLLPPAGIAAAAGLVCLMVGAIAFHLRVRDVRGASMPAVLGALASVTVGLALAGV